MSFFLQADLAASSAAPVEAPAFFTPISLARREANLSTAVAFALMLSRLSRHTWGIYSYLVSLAGQQAKF
jgi:hypothetical protein